MKPLYCVLEMTNSGFNIQTCVTCTDWFDCNCIIYSVHCGNEQSCFYAMMGDSACVLFVFRINMNGFYRMAVTGTILTGSGWWYVFTYQTSQGSTCRHEEIHVDWSYQDTFTITTCPFADPAGVQKGSSKFNAGGQPCNNIGLASLPDRSATSFPGSLIVPPRR